MKRCVICKGRGFCGRERCPILERFYVIKSLSIGDSIFGATPPSFLVGHRFYPKVYTGVLIPPEVFGEGAILFDAPDKWISMSIQDVVEYRSRLVRSNIRTHVRHVDISPMQECALSSKPLDTEAWFEKPPKLEVRFDDTLMPVGPSGNLKKLVVADNPVVPKKVDKTVSDYDLNAEKAVIELYEHGIQKEYITRLLSAGLLGIRRRLVPTRWAITATEDMVGRELIKRILDFETIDCFELFHGERFGNHFEILLIPAHYSYEIVEIWMKNTLWSSDGCVIWDGERTKPKRYSQLGGGYYAARISVLEHLYNRRRQASIFIVREVYPSYWAPLGSWVISKTVDEAMKGMPEKFDNFEDAVAKMETRLETPKHKWLKKNIIHGVLSQRTLLDY
jgi:hypothetical protein